MGLGREASVVETLSPHPWHCRALHLSPGTGLPQRAKVEREGGFILLSFLPSDFTCLAKARHETYETRDQQARWGFTPALRREETRRPLVGKCF